jgi:peptide deformylase
LRLKIVQAGEEVLRRQARALSRDEIFAEETQRLIEYMKDTMRDAPGVGLAAPQIGLSLRLAVIEDRQEYYSKLSSEQLAERQRQAVPLHVIINPGIVSAEEGIVEFFEGCLSVNGYSAIVPRLRTIIVEYLNERAEPVRVEASGWYARILQHEIDHLSGILYTDRMYARTFSTLENVDRLWKDLPASAVKTKLDR